MSVNGEAVRLPTTRQKITASQLYAYLDRQLRARKRTPCANCRMPLPYYCEPPDDVSANWHIGTPKECPELCHAIIAEILAEAWPRFELVEETATQ